ncbi:MAG: hypothetical protein ABSF22_08910 [Bryobacteraceae bacterium]
MYTEIVLKNITLSADADLIEKARMRAMKQKKALNLVFREWLEHYAGHGSGPDDYRQLMKELRHVRAGRKFTRDEMNAR